MSSSGKYPDLGSQIILNIWGQVLIKLIQIRKSLSAIQDYVMHLTFMLVFQSNVGLDYSDPDSNFSGLQKAKAKIIM